MDRDLDYADYVKWTFIKLKKDFIDDASTSTFLLPEVIQLLDHLIQNLKPKITNLDLFFECTSRWSILSSRQPLSLLSLDVVQFFEKLWSEMCRLDKITFPQPPPSFSLSSSCRCLFPCFSNEIKIKLDCASQWIDLLSHADESLIRFTAEISKCFLQYGCPFPSKFQYQVGDEYRYPHFTTKLESCLNSIDWISFPDLALQISAFNENLREIVNGNHLTGRPDLLMVIQEVCVEAGLLFCKYYFTEKITGDSTLANAITDSFSRLNSKIDIMGSHFFDISVKFLTREMPHNEQLADFVLQINCLTVYAKNHPLYHDLVSLIILLLQIPQQEFPEGFENFSLCVKKVIMEIGSVQEHMLQEHEIDLHEEIWFLKMDIAIFFYQQLYFVPKSFLLQNMSFDSIKECTKFMSTNVEKENVEHIITLHRQVLSDAELLYQSFRSQEISADMVRVCLHRLILKIVLFRAESSLVKLLKKDERLMAKTTTRHQMNSLLQGLRFLTMNVCYMPDDELMDSEMVFLRMESVARRVVPLRCSVITVRITQESELLLHDLVDEIRNISIQLKEMSMFDLMLKFPKTNRLGFMDSLVTKLKEYLQSGLSAYLEHVIQEILCSLKDIRPLLNVIQEQTVKTQELKKLLTLLINAAYETELLIDSLVLGIDEKCHILIRLYHLMEDIKLFNLKLGKIYENKDYIVQAHEATHASSFMLLKDNIPTVKGVCLNDQEEEIIDRLIGGPSRQDIVSLVGMPGIGKTTLARRVYNDPKVIYHFHVRVWCYVSQKYNKASDKKRLLLEILSHIVGSNVKLYEMTVEDLESKLHQRLLKKRYLVVLDDLWHIKAWNDLVRSFPDNGNGCRILMTSRLNDLGLKANPSSYYLPVRLMSNDESWNLLRMKIFHDEGFSNELIVLGKQIASNCTGLPLAVVSIAGILGRIEKTYESWKKVAENLSSIINADPQTQCRNILELSYNHLPDYLKACFLYFGVFLEQNDIPVSKLIALWIAEGFIQKSGSNLLEDVGEAYLMDLVRRNLLITSEERSIGGMKSCRVHDLLRDLCLSKSKEENFLQPITMREEVISCDGLDYGEDYVTSVPHESETYEAHRICIFSKRRQFVLSEPSGPHVRSLLFFADSDMNPTCPYNMSFVFDNFRLLRVLDLECINLGSAFPDGIVWLIHLRYLGICGNINSVPSSLKDLKNLETFLVKGLVGKVELPPTIWSMNKLRHLHVNSHAVFTSEDDNLECLSKLDNLVTLSSLLVSYREDIQTITSRFPNIRRLKCIISGSQRHSRSLKSSTKFDGLAKLQSLTLTYYGRAVENLEFSLPVNLKKLTLSNFCFPWSQISVIGRLQNLEVLKLLSRAFEGECWEMIEGEFCKLKVLKLESLNIARWDASSDHLPNLQQLVLQRCEFLEEVPSAFADIPTLQMIQVHWCSQSCENSVRQIGEDIEGLKVVINNSDAY